MKKLLALAAVSALTFGIAATTYASDFTGKQTASAHLSQQGNEVTVTVDMSDGWSAEFAHGAVYLYAGPVKDDDCAAIAMTLDEEVYNEYMDSALEQEDYFEEDDVTYFVEEYGMKDYFFKVGDDAYFMISVFPDFDEKEVKDRIEVVPFAMPDDDEYTEETAEESEYFSNEDISDAKLAILDEFHKWTGCELGNLEYAGDDAITDEVYERVRELGGKDYTHVIEFLMDFHSPSDEATLKGTTWEPDSDYNDYQWYLGRTDDGEWEIVTYGY